MQKRKKLTVKNKNRFRYIKFLAPPLFLAGLFVFLVNTPFFTTKKIECYTQFGSCTPDYLSLADWLKGRPILTALPIAQIKKQYSSYPEIQSVSVYRRLPSTIVIGLALRKPLGALGADVLGAQAIADEQGHVYKHIDQTNLPLLFTQNAPAVTDRLSSEQLKALTILENISSLSDYRLTASLSGTSLSVNFAPSLELVIDVNRELSNWYPSLQHILARSKITAKMPRIIDLRFDNSVIVY